MVARLSDCFRLPTAVSLSSGLASPLAYVTNTTATAPSLDRQNDNRGRGHGCVNFSTVGETQLPRFRLV
jgi:hypothetical protein